MAEIIKLTDILIDNFCKKKFFCKQFHNVLTLIMNHLFLKRQAVYYQVCLMHYNLY